MIKKEHDIFKQRVICIQKRLAPSSKEVQSTIEKHHGFTDSSKDVYKALAELYTDPLILDNR